MSSAQKSNLGNYGYDLVVATTQGALNSTMLEYLFESKQIEGTTKCYIWVPDANGNPIIAERSFEELLSMTPNGVDPFKISATAKAWTDAGVQALVNIGFAAAYVSTCERVLVHH